MNWGMGVCKPASPHPREEAAGTSRWSLAHGTRSSSTFASLLESGVADAGRLSPCVLDDDRQVGPAPEDIGRGSEGHELLRFINHEVRRVKVGMVLVAE
jgi:hypothetical protein